MTLSFQQLGCFHSITLERPAPHSGSSAIAVANIAERGYSADLPVKFDLETGEITCSTKRIYRFQVRFKGSEVRRGI